MAFRTLVRVVAATVAPLACVAVSQDVAAQSARALDVRAERVIEHWTPERRNAAVPRDLVIDPYGMAYLRGRDGALTPYGHTRAANGGPSENAKPGGGGSGDGTGPAVSSMNPGQGATVTSANQGFSATVTDASGVKSVSMKIQKGSGRAQSFAMGAGAGGTYSVSLSGLTDGSWSWWVVATDASGGKGNTTTSATVNFTVAIGGGGDPGGPGEVPNDEWDNGGTVQQAAGRIYFEMPANARRTRWDGFVCSGTVANDGTSGRSIVITAAHCVYDDANKAFARNVLFIPDQDGTTGGGTDLTCGNDPKGCWVPSLGVVDTNWTTRTFPDNVAWDYAFYVVDDTGAHQPGINAAPDALDAAVGPMSVSFSTPGFGNLTHALGYSYDMDPQFMYCADGLAEDSPVNWWLGNCGLTGGSSGGPWVQPMSTSTGNGPIISVNSWGFTGQPGMAGPKLSGTSAACIFAVAKAASIASSFPDGDAGVAVSTCN